MENQNHKQRRVLVISHKPPYPSVDGGTAAMANFMEMLQAAGSDITWFSIGTQKHPYDTAMFPAEVLSGVMVTGQNIHTGFALGDIYPIFFDNRPYRALRFLKPSVKKTLKSLLASESFDCIILESLFPAVYLRFLRKYYPGKILLRSHNIEAAIWEKQAFSGLRSMFMKRDNRKLERWEKHTWNTVDGVISISPEDSAVICRKTHVPVITIPFCLKPQTGHGAVYEPPGILSLFHIGAMDWNPNLEGIRWFLREVIPQLDTPDQRVELHLAGKAMPEEFSSGLPSFVINHGTVPSSSGFISQHHVLVVPLFSGSGIRIKTLEAMVAGKVVISTSKGMQGIPADDGKHYLKADTAAEFAEKIFLLSHTPGLWKQISQQASDFVREEYGFDKKTSEIRNFIQHIL